MVKLVQNVIVRGTRFFRLCAPAPTIIWQLHIMRQLSVYAEFEYEFLSGISFLQGRKPRLSSLLFFADVDVFGSQNSMDFFNEIIDTGCDFCK